MADMSDDYDLQMIEAMRAEIFGNSTFDTDTCVERVRIEHALRLIGISAAALNALWRGEAVVVPKVLTREIVDVIARDIWPDDYNAGKKVQRAVGLHVVPPKTEHETACGQYLRALAVSPLR